MTIDKRVNDVLKLHPDIKQTLNNYARTGFKPYEIMLDWYMKDIIKPQYGNDVYNQLNHILKEIKEIYR